jgi:hypothetical protein
MEMQMVVRFRWTHMHRGSGRVMLLQALHIHALCCTFIHLPHS